MPGCTITLPHAPTFLDLTLPRAPTKRLKRLTLLAPGVMPLPLPRHTPAPWPACRWRTAGCPPGALQRHVLPQARPCAGPASQLCDPGPATAGRHGNPRIPRLQEVESSLEEEGGGRTCVLTTAAAALRNREREARGWEGEGGARTCVSILVPQQGVGGAGRRGGVGRDSGVACLPATHKLCSLRVCRLRGRGLEGEDKVI